MISLLENDRKHLSSYILYNQSNIVFSKKNILETYAVNNIEVIVKWNINRTLSNEILLPSIYQKITRYTKTNLYNCYKFSQYILTLCVSDSCLVTLAHAVVTAIA